MTSNPSRKRTYLILVIVAIVIALAVAFLTRSKPLAVVLKLVDRGSVEASVSNTRAGTVKACRRAKLSAPAGGQISHMRVKKGQRVVAGQILLELWDDDMHAQERLSRDQLKTSEMRVREVCSMAEASQRDAERSKELKEKGFISSQLLDKALTDAKSRQAGCEAARNDIEQSKSRIEVVKAGLERMVLRAPFAGIVADISGEQGEYATPSPPGILTLPAVDLIDDSCLYVSAPIDEVDAAKLKVGQSSRITLDAIKVRTFAGKVRRIAPYVLELEKQARTVEVEVGFTELPAAENLLVGYSADVEIIHEAHSNVIRIPTQTLLEGKRVLVYKADGKLDERVITTGLANWEYTEVLSGLSEGEQIVFSLDRPGLKAGVLVQPESSVAK
ncbi:MAG: efflux RND transporter periplasmic adaptor subunit [Gallionellaceae bacterium]|nr:efflux RND transporter periplasmic adaptor subunit [Gallionellaceae bacterium]